VHVAKQLIVSSDIEPSDSATSPLSISVRPSVETVEGLESVSTESAGPVSAPTPVVKVVMRSRGGSASEA